MISLYSNKYKFLIIISIIPITLGVGLRFLMGDTAWAAPCCGVSAAIPTIITGDDRAQVQATLSQSHIIGDVDTYGRSVFRQNTSDERTQTIRLDAALRLPGQLDRWQWGLTLPMQRRILEVDAGHVSDSGFTDGALSTSFELVPIWNYGQWWPQTFVFAQFSAPLSASTYDAKKDYQIDSRSRGFFTPTVGMAFFKNWHDFDSNLVGQVHHSLSRSFQNSNGDLVVHPGWGTSASFGFGYSPSWLLHSRLRWGISLGPQWEQGLRIGNDSKNLSQRTDSQLVWVAGSQLSYLMGDTWSTTLIYTDQTLVGPAKNTSLSRTLALSLQHRFPL